MRASVLLVDDHAGFRRVARRLLESEGLTVVGEAADGREALARARELRPDVVVLDVLLPDVDGLTVAEELAALPVPPRVVLISSLARAELGERIDASPAAGFLPKDEFSGLRVAGLAGLPPW
ncbi:response regulator [Actinosynnema sp. NPDC004786]